MVRRDSDRGYHPRVIFQASVSPLPGRVPREQLRERSRAAFPARTSLGASPGTDPSTGDLCSQGPEAEVGVRACQSPLLQIQLRSAMHLATQSSLAYFRCLGSGMQPRFFAPPPRWSEHLLGVAVPKPRPLTRPPPRSLVYRPPTQTSADRVRPLGIVTVKDLPKRLEASSLVALQNRKAANWSARPLFFFPGRTWQQLLANLSVKTHQPAPTSSLKEETSSQRDPPASNHRQLQVRSV